MKEKAGHSSLIDPRHDYQTVEVSPHAELSHKEKYNNDPQTKMDQTVIVVKGQKGRWTGRKHVENK